ncbi:MAG: hypothetical protein M1813_009616 [Trichoglossum hirsutum]|nr:MAG: hypothetical protein M1813_009616 [Trichoglossum hirsutum]
MPPNRVRSKRKVAPSRRAYENTLSRSTARPAPSRTPKRRSRTPEQIDLTSNDLPDLEPKQQVGRKPPKPHEPLPTKYTMSTQVIVDKTLILTRLVLQAAEAFDYAGFIAEETQMTTEHCAKLGQELKLPPVEPEREAPELHEDENEDDANNDDEEAEKTCSFKKNTATNVCLAEARAAPHSPATNQFMDLYRCGDKNCNNSAGYCFSVEGLKSGHHRLTADSIRQWVLAIEEGMTTVHNPLQSVWNSIMNLKKAWKSAPSPPSTAAPAPPPYAPPLYYTLYALPVPMPFGSAGPYSTPAEALNQ